MEGNHKYKFSKRLRDPEDESELFIVEGHPDVPSVKASLARTHSVMPPDSNDSKNISYLFYNEVTVTNLLFASCFRLSGSLALLLRA